MTLIWHLSTSKLIWKLFISYDVTSNILKAFKPKYYDKFNFKLFFLIFLQGFPDNTIISTFPKKLLFVIIMFRQREIAVFFKEVASRQKNTRNQLSNLKFIFTLSIHDNLSLHPSRLFRIYVYLTRSAFFLQFILLESVWAIFLPILHFCRIFFRGV